MKIWFACNTILRKVGVGGSGGHPLQRESIYYPVSPPQSFLFSAERHTPVNSLMRKPKTQALLHFAKQLSLDFIREIPSFTQEAWVWKKKFSKFIFSSSFLDILPGMD